MGIWHKGNEIFRESCVNLLEKSMYLVQPQVYLENMDIFVHTFSVRIIIR